MLRTSTLTVAITIVTFSVAITLAIPSTNIRIVEGSELQSIPALQLRQGLGAAVEDVFVAGLRGASSGALSTIFGHAPTCCDDKDGAFPGCHLNAGKSAAGHKWMACYYPGKSKIFDFDVAAMKCIINLHYIQRDACIDIAGSVCGKGYGGGLMKGEMGFLGGNIKADQLSAQDSATLQAAADSMLNVTIEYSKTVIPIDLVLPSDQGTLRLEIFFDGHQGKEC